MLKLIPNHTYTQTLLLNHENVISDQLIGIGQNLECEFSHDHKTSFITT